MRALILSTHDSGGAGIAIHRLHRSLLRRGMSSAMVVSTKRTADETVLEAPRGTAFSRCSALAVRAALRLATRQDYHFQQQLLETGPSAAALLRTLPFRPNVIIAGWISRFVSPRLLRELSRISGAPVLWYLMDMAPLTGGCHYAWDCTGYQRSCGNCPALPVRHPGDLSHRIMRGKRRELKDCDLTMVAASGQLQQQCARSSLCRGRRVERIMLSVDPDIFRPGDRRLARNAVGLPAAGKVVLIGAQSLSVRRKGTGQLVDALRRLGPMLGGAAKLVTIAAIGPAAGLRGMLPSVFGFRALGFMHGDRSLAECYRAADVFVCPSIQDSGPMMINEAIMSGTPVVSFDIGVAADLVATGSTGYRAVSPDARDLAAGIAAVLDLDAPRADAMAARCRDLGLRMCHPAVQAGAFRDLMREVTA